MEDKGIATPELERWPLIAKDLVWDDDNMNLNTFGHHTHK